MKHLVQYHSVEAQGYDFPRNRSSRRKQSPPDDYAQVATNKAVAHLHGSIVWCVSGRGAPRVYELRYVFLVDEVGSEGSGDSLQNFVRGRTRIVFDDPPRLPPVTLTDLDWFKEFRRSQGNFAFGLNTIRAEFVPRFEALLPEGHPFR